MCYPVHRPGTRRWERETRRMPLKSANSGTCNIELRGSRGLQTSLYWHAVVLVPILQSSYVYLRKKLHTRGMAVDVAASSTSALRGFQFTVIAWYWFGEVIIGVTSEDVVALSAFTLLSSHFTVSIYVVPNNTVQFWKLKEGYARKPHTSCVRCERNLCHVFWLHSKLQAEPVLYRILSML